MERHRDSKEDLLISFGEGTQEHNNNIMNSTSHSMDYKPNGTSYSLDSTHDTRNGNLCEQKSKIRHKEYTRDITHSSNHAVADCNSISKRNGKVHTGTNHSKGIRLGHSNSVGSAQAGLTSDTSSSTMSSKASLADSPGLSLIMFSGFDSDDE